jgi:hypothetical protein
MRRIIRKVTAHSPPNASRAGRFVRFSGALRLFAGGLLIIAFHPYRSNAAAVLTLPFGRSLALRALAFVATPERHERAARSMDAVPLVRLIFGVLVVIGLYLTPTGRLAKPARPY